MSLLITGLVIWSAVHLFKAVSPVSRGKIERKMGTNLYRGGVSLVIIGALILIVVGWKSAVPQGLYAAPLRPGPVISALVWIGLVLFFASQFSGNIKRFVRHPQMTGTLLWSAAHLLTNGDSRSVTLFGGLAVWAMLEIFFINRRDGRWQRPEPAVIRFDIIPVVIGTAVFAAVLRFHLTLFGVAPY